MNLAALMKFKEELGRFKARHPKFPLFLKAVHQRALREGSVIDIKVTSPDGTVLSSNLKLTSEDMELFQRMKDSLS